MEWIRRPRRRRPVAAHGVLVATLAAAWGCAFVDPDMTVAVELPAFPSAWSGAEAWELSWVSAGASGGPFVGRPGDSIALELPRGREAAVLCAAALGPGRSLPYGVPWPQGLSTDGVLRPTAAGGYAASLAAAFYRAGSPACPLDMPRFAFEAEARLDDPWDVDPGYLAPIVAARRFRVDHLKASPRVTVSVAGLPYALCPDSPWGAAVAPDATGTARVEIVPGRVRRWFGGGYELAVSAFPSGDSAWTLSGTDVHDGMVMTKALPAPSRLSTDTSPP